LYLGSEITLNSLIIEPDHSIINQSFQSKERKEPLNGDGFGVAWYVPHISNNPIVFKDITPAWSNINLHNLAPVMQSGCVLAHVRAATRGFPVVQLNCHPFSYGPFSFAHNGAVRGFSEIRRTFTNRLSDEAFRSIVGSTDSEHIFALFMDHYRSINTDEDEDRSEAMAEALMKTITDIVMMKKEAGIEGRSILNIAITDGISAVASRYIDINPDRAASLYIHSNGEIVCSNGEYIFEEREMDRRSIIVASEPLNKDDGWQKVEPNRMVVLKRDRSFEIRKIDS
jgi:predicted glutamine amidotransferase